MTFEPSKCPKYVLHYFDFQALGESIRLLFHYGGIPFEDHRIKQDEWPAIKPTMPMQQIPDLDIDGYRVHQSLAINSYVGKLVGLAGSNDFENLVIDVVANTINDFRTNVYAVFFEHDTEIKQKKFPEFNKNVIPFYMDKLEEIAKQNMGYLALGRLTWVDFYFMGMQDMLNMMCRQNLVENRPNLQQVIRNVSNLEQLQHWFSVRPKTDF